MARILHVVPAYLPATLWGGPVFSTSALVRAAVRAGHETTVLTTNSADPETGEFLSLDQNPARFPEGYDVHYMHRSFGQSGSWEMLRKLSGMVRRADLVHLSMTYSFPTLPTLALCKIFGKPVVWSPRGAIQATAEWADAPRKRAKTAFESLARGLAPKRTVLHVTAQSEKDATAGRMPGLDIVTIANAVAVPDTVPQRVFRPDGRLRLLFISRLHPKKGIDQLIATLARLPDHITLTVAGSGSPAFEAELNAQVVALGLGARITFLGQVNDAAKSAAFHEADALVLPTLSENFGIAIAEGLAHGLPVITTTGAPWEGIKAHRCGDWIDPTPEALEAALTALDAIDVNELSAMGARGYAWMKDTYSEAILGADMMAVYDRILDQGRPSE
ncbi:glycosyltransferase [Pelagimonas varians]|uniref:GDP-mannose-dependent alpha-(1-2)-phosphatidylinositol mannosyltransferase n=1 Tax=Pelagimonas varians TaxID=696760 RepID=A0A238L5S0_9RHOB|nr:glycosyltransferase [Pelagimonas varians]PYG25490.1 glycosyltransferase involved in cell wall biosynthesis [Pelagimonas varians]SMX50349.1 GDP-mannose-dependent alpha-(1-2)-phosphatidylinositol mannosyltransferase [Pelagimonas varians]